MKYAFFDQFGELTPGTTNAWAFENIESNSRVLEIGSSVGYLTKHLKEEKNCQVDIVEIDEEAGKIAAQFARKAYIGAQGDLDSDCLKNIPQEDKYDYIVILDVLEHLRTPEKVIKDVGTLLASEGKVILSVPNVAHNAVLINLFNNRFQYTDLGLLDRTHITFFTYNSLIQMLQDAGFSALEFDAHCKVVSETEIQTSYDQLPRDVRSFFLSRAYGNAYQFLLILHIRKDSGEVGKTAPYYQDSMELRSSLYYCQFEGEKFDERRKVDKAVKLGYNVLEFPVDPEQRYFRFGPSGHNCILRNLQIFGKSLDEKNEEIDHYTVNGIDIGDDCVAFTGMDAACLEFHVGQPIKSISLSFELMACDQEALDVLDSPMRTLPQMHNELVRVYGENGSLRQDYRDILQEKQKLGETVQQLSSEKQAMQEEVKKTQEEMNCLMTSLQEARCETVELRKLLQEAHTNTAELNDLLHKEQNKSANLDELLHQTLAKKYDLEKTIVGVEQLLTETLEENAYIETEYRELSWQLYQEKHRGFGRIWKRNK